jgi:hypothetical protein
LLTIALFFSTPFSYETLAKVQQKRMSLATFWRHVPTQQPTWQVVITGHVSGISSLSKTKVI